MLKYGPLQELEIFSRELDVRRIIAARRRDGMDSATERTFANECFYQELRTAALAEGCKAAIGSRCRI